MPMRPARSTRGPHFLSVDSWRGAGSVAPVAHMGYGMRGICVVHTRGAAVPVRGVPDGDSAGCARRSAVGRRCPWHAPGLDPRSRGDFAGRRPSAGIRAGTRRHGIRPGRAVGAARPAGLEGRIRRRAAAAGPPGIAAGARSALRARAFVSAVGRSRCGARRPAAAGAACTSCRPLPVSSRRGRVVCCRSAGRRLLRRVLGRSTGGDPSFLHVEREPECADDDHDDGRHDHRGEPVDQRERHIEQDSLEPRGRIVRETPVRQGHRDEQYQRRLRHRGEQRPVAHHQHRRDASEEVQDCEDPRQLAAAGGVDEEPDKGGRDRAGQSAPPGHAGRRGQD